ncbi:hypothetical protein XELAEV_18020328mg [Xenopus laevis]|uniref:Helix-turn-helix domain-containing protein n=1 Tax=Xenopus laevis TaxID=8355 RepID=A0A974HQJ6_XENLA|nr:hypothetical protein XELAEV_18020328mg [Xenopus laevis]
MVFGDELAEYTQYIPIWLLYIDDIILVWSGTQEKLHEFISRLNVNKINLKVTAEIDKNTVNFLDKCIFRGADNNIQTSLYRKKTATNNLLHASNQHPQNTIKGIPTGQYLRVRRLCSTLDDFKAEAKKLYLRFKQRGNSHNSLKKAYNKALAAHRNTLLIPRKHFIDKKKTDEQSNIIRLIAMNIRKSNKYLTNTGTFWNRMMNSKR